MREIAFMDSRTEVSQHSLVAHRWTESTGKWKSDDFPAVEQFAGDHAFKRGLVVVAGLLDHDTTRFSGIPAGLASLVFASN
jgi:hypothetical protein